MGIRASGEDGLIDREGKEGNRNQDRPRGGQEVGMPSVLCVLRGQDLYSHSHTYSRQDREGCVQLVPTLGEEGTGEHRPRLGFQAVQVGTEGILSDKLMSGGDPRMKDSP